MSHYLRTPRRAGRKGWRRAASPAAVAAPPAGEVPRGRVPASAVPTPAVAGAAGEAAVARDPPRRDRRRPRTRRRRQIRAGRPLRAPVGLPWAGRSPGRLRLDSHDRIVAFEALGRQLALEHLEGHRAGEFGADPDVGRPLLGPEVGLPGQESADLLGVELGPRRQHQRGHHLVADHRFRHRVDGHLGHVGVPQQHPLDRGGAQVLAVDPHPITKPPREIRIAGLVAVGQIAGVVYPARHPLGLGGLVVVVALEAARPGGVHQLADHSGRTGRTGVGVDDLDALGQRAQRTFRGVGGARDRHPAFGGTEPVLDDAAESARESFDVAGDALVPVDGPQRVVRVVRPLGRGEHVRQGLADVVGVGGAEAADIHQEVGGGELAPQRQ